MSEYAKHVVILEIRDWPDLEALAVVPLATIAAVLRTHFVSACQKTILPWSPVKLANP